jgi:hypothetical protein
MNSTKTAKIVGMLMSSSMNLGRAFMPHTNSALTPKRAASRAARIRPITRSRRALTSWNGSPATRVTKILRNRPMMPSAPRTEMQIIRTSAARLGVVASTERPEG